MTQLQEMNYGEGAAVSKKDLPVVFDPLKAYLKEISAHPVLSREEELETTRLIHEHDDSEAAQRLALANLRLVVKISLGYYNSYLNILDMIQEGNVGLLRAVKKYNPYKGTKFSSYASFWIRAYILKYIMDSWSLVKVGTTQAERRLFYGLNKEKRNLESLGIYPSPERLSSDLGVKTKEVEEMAQRLGHGDVSLDAPLPDESGHTMLDTIAHEDDVEELVSRSQESEAFSQKVVEFRSTLNDRDALILDRRLLAEEPDTLQELGERFSISRERVRQLEIKIMGRLKTSFRKERAAFGM